jgi:di/tricarboxylate transporter
MKQGAAPFRGDRWHYYDLLLSRGWTPRTVALTSYALTILLATAGLWMLRGVESAALIFARIVAAGIFGASIARYFRNRASVLTKTPSHDLPLPD